MKITKQAVVDANWRIAQQWCPKASNDDDDIYKQKVENLISVSTEDHADIIQVAFNTRLAWAIRDNTPDADEVLNWLRGMVPAAGGTFSLGTLAINGGNILSSTNDLITSILKTTNQAFAASFKVPGAGRENAEEHYKMAVKIDGFLRTTDTGKKEHACIPRAWAEFQTVSSPVEGRYNVGNDDITIASFRFDVPCQKIGKTMISEADLVSILKTDGVTFGATLCAVTIWRVVFEFRKCDPPSKDDTALPPMEEESATGSDKKNMDKKTSGMPKSKGGKKAKVKSGHEALKDDSGHNAKETEGK